MVVIFPRKTADLADKQALLSSLEQAERPSRKTVDTIGTATTTALPASGTSPGSGALSRHDRYMLDPNRDLIPVRLPITGSFFKTLQASRAIGKLAKALGLPRLAETLGVHLIRPLVWNLNPTSQVLAGDTCSFVFRAVGEKERRSRSDEPDVIEIKAIRYVSGRLEQTLRLYHFKPAGWRYGTFFHADGTGVERRLENPPLADYIQITSPYHAKRGRFKHEGVDFKVPVGTPLTAPFDGVVSRVNWRFKGNGRCLEIALDRQPYCVKMLHLEKVLVRPGDRVRAGQQVALSGNTGRSLAPHLHYQINRGCAGPSLDPFTFHQTRPVILPEQDRAAFRETVDEYDRLWEEIQTTARRNVEQSNAER